MTDDELKAEMGSLKILGEWLSQRAEALAPFEQAQRGRVLPARTQDGLVFYGASE